MFYRFEKLVPANITMLLAVKRISDYTTIDSANGTALRSQANHPRILDICLVFSAPFLDRQIVR